MGSTIYSMKQHAPGSTLLICAFAAMGTGVGADAGLGLCSDVKLTQLPGSLITSHTTPVAFGRTRPCAEQYQLLSAHTDTCLDVAHINTGVALAADDKTASHSHGSTLRSQPRR